MKASEEINGLLRMAKELRKVSTGECDKFLKEHSSVDKHGFGFNLYERFNSTTEHTLRYDSWLGYYGNSSCSTWLHFNDSVRFWKFFEIWINQHQKEVLGGMAELFEKEAKAKTEELIKERDGLSEMIAQLEGGDHGEVQ